MTKKKYNKIKSKLKNNKNFFIQSQIFLEFIFNHKELIIILN